MMLLRKMSVSSLPPGSQPNNTSGDEAPPAPGNRHAELLEQRRVELRQSAGGGDQQTQAPEQLLAQEAVEAVRESFSIAMVEVHKKLDKLTAQMEDCLGRMEQKPPPTYVPSVEVPVTLAVSHAATPSTRKVQLMLSPGRGTPETGSKSRNAKPPKPEESEIEVQAEGAERETPRETKIAKMLSPANSQSSIGTAKERHMPANNFPESERSNSQPYDPAGGGHRERKKGERRDSFRQRISVNSGSSDLVKELIEALNRVRKRSETSKLVWAFLEDPDTVFGGRLFMRFMSLAIVVSAFVPVIQTVDPPPLQTTAVSMLEIFLDGVFALEVVARFMTCPNRLAFCFSFYNMIDVAAGLLVLLLRTISTSSLIQADSQGSSVLVSLICAVPILRLLKLLRRFENFHLILRAFKLASEALPVLLFILSILVLFFASLIYVVEPRDNIESLPRALWLTIVTVGTIGYGDVVPHSPAGSLSVSALVIVSALYMAIPIGIVGKAFSTVWDDRDRLLLTYRARNRFLSSGYKAKDVPTMFCNFDIDGDGSLSLEEFLAMMTQLQLDLAAHRVVELFRTFDSDGSGAIDDKEFVRTLFPGAYAEIYGHGKAEEHTDGTPTASITGSASSPAVEKKEWAAPVESPAPVS